MALFYQQLGNFTKIKQTQHLPVSFSATYKCLHSYLHLKCFICQLQRGICKCRLVMGALLAAASSSFQMWLLLDISCPDL